MCQKAFQGLLSTAPGISTEHHLLWDSSAQRRKALELLLLCALQTQRDTNQKGKPPAAARHPAPAWGVCVDLPCEAPGQRAPSEPCGWFTCLLFFVEWHWSASGGCCWGYKGRFKRACKRNSCQGVNNLKTPCGVMESQSQADDFKIDSSAEKNCKYFQILWPSFLFTAKACLL